jgi:UDP-N-acetylglucosamine 2-epimerase (non-hydrolysing)
MLVFGTRPEAVKMCPLVNEFKGRVGVETVVCVTGQHREMLDSVLEIFRVEPQYDLCVMKENQTLSDITTKILEQLCFILDKESPDIVLVHGDTTTSFAAALACYYKEISVGHVEAGLRTYCIRSPFPEEFNRQAVSVIADYHFAPTLLAKENLLREGKRKESIFVTGNTVVDALRSTVREEYSHPMLDWVGKNRMIFLTAHRRESIGNPMRRMFRAVRRILKEYPDIKAVYPIHKNPNVRKIASEELADCANLLITEPLDVIECHNILARSFLVLTDSGGIQEEASSLGKPVLVMRDTTERSEGVCAGTLKLVGTDEEEIYGNCKLLLENEAAYRSMTVQTRSYGDGLACRRIADILLNPK